MVTSLDPEKAFDQRSWRQLEKQGTNLNIIRAFYNKPTRQQKQGEIQSISTKIGTSTPSIPIEYSTVSLN